VVTPSPPTVTPPPAVCAPQVSALAPTGSLLAGERIALSGTGFGSTAGTVTSPGATWQTGDWEPGIITTWIPASAQPGTLTGTVTCSGGGQGTFNVPIGTSSAVTWWVASEMTSALGV
jgi:hypothetical protein